MPDGAVTTRGPVEQAFGPCADCPARVQTDQLTGLADRRRFETRLREVLADPGGRPLAVLMIDLDRFKAVNDALGHPAGDALLRAAGNRLRGALRPADLGARLGGDEFAVLLDGADRVAAAAVAGRLCDMLGRPYLVGGRVAQVGASVGVALAPVDGSDAETLARHADLALYAAKSGGRGRVAHFVPALQHAANTRRALEQDLRAALALGEFELHYQPQVDLGRGGLAGFEALLRWRNPARGLVSPGDFLPLAEELGLLSSIGGWVLRAACREAVGWPGDLTVAVNVAAQQFENEGLPGLVASALAATGLPPTRLEIEITETALMRDAPAAIAQLHAIRATGVTVSLDDFGTGYSSLTQLRSFPFDRIKIDRSFADDAPVVRAIAALGTSLGMRTIAEGVETAGQLARIRADGCDEAQGYLLSRPVPAGDVGALIALLGRDTEENE